jgi:2-dehydropantoate 2-reductase
VKNSFLLNSDKNNYFSFNVNICNEIKTIMKIVIVGSGGVGGYFGARLAQSGNEVTFIARGEHLKKIKRDGLYIKGISGDFHIYPVRATDRFEEAGEADLIFLGVKAWQVKEDARDLKPVLTSRTIIIPLQNGILAADEIKAELPGTAVLGGLARIMSKIESPGVISHFGIEPTIIFGELDNKRTDRVLKIKEIFDKAGIYSKIAENIQVELWKKLIVICVGGLLAVTRSTYGEIRDLNETRKLIREVLDEICNLALKMGVPVKKDFIDTALNYVDTLPYDSASSLTRDIWEGKPSELEYQNGTVVKLGEKCRIPTPVNRFIYYTLLPQELRARKKNIPSSKLEGYPSQNQV